MIRSCKSEGEDSCRNTLSFASSPGEFCTLLVSKLPELLSFTDSHRFPGNDTFTTATLHSGNSAVYSAVLFVHFAAVVWLQLLLLPFWLGSYTTPLEVQTGHLTNSTKQSLVLFLSLSLLRVYILKCTL